MSIEISGIASNLRLVAADVLTICLASPRHHVGMIIKQPPDSLVSLYAMSAVATTRRDLKIGVLKYCPSISEIIRTVPHSGCT